jgi:hypothetical protein
MAGLNGSRTRSCRRRRTMSVDRARRGCLQVVAESGWSARSRRFWPERGSRADRPAGRTPISASSRLSMRTFAQVMASSSDSRARRAGRQRRTRRSTGQPKTADPNGPSATDRIARPAVAPAGTGGRSARNAVTRSTPTARPLWSEAGMISALLQLATATAVGQHRPRCATRRSPKCRAPRYDVQNRSDAYARSGARVHEPAATGS